MKKSLRSCFFAAATLLAFAAQAQTQEVVATAGGTLTGAGGALSFTVGQPIAGDIKQGPLLHQGFQVYLLPAGLITAVEEDNLRVNLYPNPFQDRLIIETETTGQTTVHIIDNLGRTVHPQLRVTERKTSLDLSTLPRGVYVLQLHSPQGNTRTYQLVKSH